MVEFADRWWTRIEQDREESLPKNGGLNANNISAEEMVEAMSSRALVEVTITPEIQESAQKVMHSLADAVRGLHFPTIHLPTLHHPHREAA